MVHSAFGFAGQKCSAAARVLAHEAVHDALVERLAGAVEVLDVGQAERFATEVPPVIEREAQERVRGYAERGRGRAARSPPGAAAPGGGWFCPPTLATGLGRGRARAARGGLRPAAHRGAGGVGGGRVRRGRLAALRAHRRAVLAQPGDRGGGGRAHAGGQPLREPRHHRRDGGAPALRRQPPLGHRLQGGRARTTCCSSWSRAWSPRTRCATGWWSSEGRTSQ